MSAHDDTWDRWRFESMETDLLLLADSLDLEYDSTHPLSLLPAQAPQQALKHTGLTYAEVASIACVNYATVTGWFNPNRNPTRATVRNGIFPALCEGYSRMDGKAPGISNDPKKVAKRVFLILTTGSAKLPEEKQADLDEARERFHRSALTYAASKLGKSDLASIAHSALGFLALNHDQIETNGDFGWSVDQGQNTIYMRGLGGGEPNSIHALELATNEMDQETWRSRLEELPLETLQVCMKQLEAEIDSRGMQREVS